MRLHPSARVHEEWVDIIRDYEASGELVTFYMTLGNKDISHMLESGTLSADIGALPWTLDCDLTGRVPISLLGAPVRLYCEMAGALFEIFSGISSYPAIQDNWSTQLNAMTAGHLMDKATLDEYVTFSGWPPQNVIRNALYRVPYDRNGVRVEKFDDPLIYRIREETPPSSAAGSWASGFEDEDVPKSILDSVLTEVDGISTDTPTNGNVTIKDPGMGEGLELAWDYDETTQEVLEPFHAQWASPEDLYTRVAVRDKFEDGSYRIPPEYWPVNYRYLDYPPQVERTLYMSLSDQSSNALSKARRAAFRKAEAIGKGLWAGSSIVAFNPFLSLSDVVTYRAQHEDDSGVYTRLFRCVIESISLQWGNEALSTELGWRAALILDRRLPDPPIRLYGISPGVIAVPGEGIAYGWDENGDWVDPAKISGLSWAGVETIGGVSYGWFDPELAPDGVFGVDEITGEPYINIERSLYGVTGDYLYFDESLVWESTTGDYMDLDEGTGPVTVTGDYFDVV